MRAVRAPLQLPPRKFSTAVRTLAESVKPLQQESQASKQRSETLHEHEAAGAEPIAETQPSPARNTPFRQSSAPTTEPTSKLSRQLSPLPQRAQSDWDYLKTARRITGTVIHTHTMSKTVAVATARQYFDRFLQKHYTKPCKTLVHDPEEMLVEGDVIEYGLFPPAERAQRIKMGKGKRVKYMVMRVVTPFGVPLEQRSKRVVMSWGAPSKKRGEAEVGAEGEVRAVLQS
jgi:ribosomal protein S17